jgi:hypothetical protein
VKLKDSVNIIHIIRVIITFFIIKVYIFCTNCNEIICDKCTVEKHASHKFEEFEGTKNNSYMINIFTNFYNRIQNSSDEMTGNFQNKMKDKILEVNNFFKEEKRKVSQIVDDLIILLRNLEKSVLKLINMYNNKFEMVFKEINDTCGEFVNLIENRM